MANASKPFTGGEVRLALRRLFVNGPLAQLPGFGPELEMLLGLASSQLEGGVTYAEGEINQRLEGWLASFSGPGADHVTLRRHLVDFRFLERDTAGSTYRLRPARAREAIEEGAAALDPAAILDEVRRDRDARKQARMARAANGG